MINKIGKINNKFKLILDLIRIYSEIRFPSSREKRIEFREKKKEQVLTYQTKYNNSLKFDQNAIPIFIISYNRLTYLQNTISFLEKYNLTNIHIIDNYSDYKPLLDYLSKIKYQVHFMDRNYGQNVLWNCDEFKKYTENSMYIVTDPDLGFNSELPKNFLEVLYHILTCFPFITKVGFALELSDLPSCEFSAEIKKGEEKYWQKRLKFEDLELYFADLDTTFALYRPGKLDSKRFYNGIRVAGKYTARHLPWYELFENNDENNYYKRTADLEVASCYKRTVDLEHDSGVRNIDKLTK